MMTGQTSNFEADSDYCYEYYPVKIVDLAVKLLIRELLPALNPETTPDMDWRDSSEAVDDLEDVYDVDVGTDEFEDDEFVEEIKKTDRELLAILNKIYPDIDLDYMMNLIQEKAGSITAIQGALESAISANNVWQLYFQPFLG